MPAQNVLIWWIWLHLIELEIEVEVSEAGSEIGDLDQDLREEDELVA